jgi:phosphoenolpyruvate carboxykinase (GTP)
MNQNISFEKWIHEIKLLCLPKNIHICQGTKQEFQDIANILVKKGSLVPLVRPNSYWCHSHVDDVARVEQHTFICTEKKEDAGPTNNWIDPNEMKQKLHSLFKGSMQGRTMYVIPYCLGPIHSSFARYGVEITDSEYVVLNMHLMTHVGIDVLPYLKSDFVRGIHSVGSPLKSGQKDSQWPCNLKDRYIVHFPENKEIWSFGSGYGGNALLSKKCFALRIASFLGKQEGWLAEHMLIMALTNPEGEKIYIAAAFPSACGKTNLAMMKPSLPGWKVEIVGDDIAWLHVDDGILYAVNPEMGFFGVAPGTSMKTNPVAMQTITHDTIFTNVALTPNKDVWWEGIGANPPENLTSWTGAIWDKKSLASHPNARFTVSKMQCPIYDKNGDNPKGVPISAIVFGSRRKDTIPLVFEAMNFEHGVFVGASLYSETTAAAKGEVGKLRHDPFAMIPFCGYNMADYFSHWLDIGKKLTKPPKIFSVNWFLQDENNQFIWPGFGENIRVLKWIFERVHFSQNVQTSAIGNLPKHLDLEGLNVNLDALLKVDPILWKQELSRIKEFFKIFGSRMPQPISSWVEKLDAKL